MPWWGYLCVGVGIWVVGYYPAAVLIAHDVLKISKRKNSVYADSYHVSNAIDAGMGVAIIWPLALVFWFPFILVIRMRGHMRKMLSAKIREI